MRQSRRRRSELRVPVQRVRDYSLDMLEGERRAWRTNAAMTSRSRAWRALGRRVLAG